MPHPQACLLPKGIFSSVASDITFSSPSWQSLFYPVTLKDDICDLIVAGKKGWGQHLHQPQTWSWPPGPSPPCLWTQEAGFPQPLGQVVTKDWAEIWTHQGHWNANCCFHQLAQTWRNYGPAFPDDLPPWAMTCSSSLSFPVCTEASFTVEKTQDFLGSCPGPQVVYSQLNWGEVVALDMCPAVCILFLQPLQVPKRGVRPSCV